MTDDKFFLGFDADCHTCRRLADQLRSEVGAKIEIIPLKGERMRAWRDGEFGASAPWAPTLARVGPSGKVELWSGWRMGPTLAQELGVATTWNVLALLGAERLEASSWIPPGLRRRSFLKAGFGVAASIAMIGGFTAPAAAGSNAPTLSGSRELLGEERRRVWKDAMRSPDALNVEGAVPSVSPTRGKLEQSSSSLSNPDPVSELQEPQGIVPFAYELTFAGGTTSTVAGYFDSVNMRIMTVVRNSDAIDGVDGSSHVYEFDGWDSEHSAPEKFRFIASSYNGEVPEPIDLSQRKAVTAADPCGGCSGCGVGDRELRGECRSAGVVWCAIGVSTCGVSAATCSFVWYLCWAYVIATCSAAVKACCDRIVDNECRSCPRRC